MRPLLLLVLLGLTAGCLASDAPAAQPAADVAPPAAKVDAAEPETFTWEGFVVASHLETPTHIQPTEQVVFPVFREGFLFSFDELPQAAEVSLDWDGDGEFMIMLHSHKEHGTNTYVEHVTPMDAEKPKCLRIPTEDLVEGEWQVMVHSRGATQAAFTLGVHLWGGAGHIVTDKYHGHWLQDGGFEIDEHEPLPCA